MSFTTDNSPKAGAMRMAIIAAFALINALAGVFSLPPLDRDESRFAQATAQMLETGDFVSIRFQDEERNKKPVGIHWLQAASVDAFSSVEAREIWAYRLPSVVGAVLAALFTYLAGARMFGPATGFLAAMMLASAPAIAGEATIAKTDAMLLAAVTAAQAALFHVFSATLDGRRPGRFAPLAFWIAIGAGVLIKGPIIVMILGLTIAALCFFRRRGDWISTLRPAEGALILILMIAPWALAINEKTDGRFFVEAIGGDMLAKLGDTKESHGGPPGYYALLSFALFWPAAAFILPGLRKAIADRAAPSFAFLLCWAAPSWIVFEAIATKLPHYTLPLYPAIALMAAHAAVSSAASDYPNLRRIGAGIYLVVGIALSALIAALPVIYSESSLKLYCFAAAAIFAVATLSAAFLILKKRSAEGAIVATLVSSAFAWTLFAGVAPNLERLALSPRLSAVIDAANLHPIRDNAPAAVLSGYYEPSAIFLLGTGTILRDGAGAADQLAEIDRAAVIEAREEGAFLERLEALGIAAQKIGEVAGVNYSNGKRVTLSIYRKPSAAEDIE